MENWFIAVASIIIFLMTLIPALGIGGTPLWIIWVLLGITIILLLILIKIDREINNRNENLNKK